MLEELRDDEGNPFPEIDATEQKVTCGQVLNQIGSFNSKLILKDGLTGSTEDLAAA